MKNFLLFPSALALGLGLVSANAAPISHTLAINATVNSGCSASAPTSTSAGLTVSGISSTFATTVSGTTSAPASGTLVFGDLVCTTPKVRVTLTSARTGLYVNGTEGNSNNKRMNYQALARLNSATLATLNTLQGAASQSGALTLPATGTNSISVEISFPGQPNELLPNGALTAGVYSDILTISIDGTTI